VEKLKLLNIVLDGEKSSSSYFIAT